MVTTRGAAAASGGRGQGCCSAPDSAQETALRSTEDPPAQSVHRAEATLAAWFLGPGRGLRPQAGTAQR